MEAIVGVCVNESEKEGKATARIITADVDVYYPTAQKRTRTPHEESQVVITRRR